MLNSELVTRCPKHPTNSRKDSPEKASESSRQRMHKRAHVEKGLRVPRIPQPGSKAAPQELGHVTLEKNMIGRLINRAQGATGCNRRVTFVKLIGGGKFGSESLPHKDFDLRGKMSFPQAREVR